ncbi:prespore-specific transcriptional regulator RsfA [Bacillus sp. J14TS2]|uniref:RsfA family transcriptional regulator n=1 Tax=Bacillus sp. J14TS2 TaxID=2807188 RepID=UPI001B19B065|nr:RsfA family transcriptional regulator [Bacillus sp. J14TS2]GIN69804.1 prespore-specific transcriptional regulator RsfA [Bacillus sp. J14TS2]
MKTRQDAWTEENDLLLAETVLRHVREGSTQLNAFEEVGDKLNRTSAACGFRWNAVVRHQYEKALDLAKKQRKQRHRVMGKEQSGKKKLLYQPPMTLLDEADMEMDEAFEILNGESTRAETTNFQENLLPAPVEPTGDLNMQKIISYLQTLQSSGFQQEILQRENERLKKQLRDVEAENNTLQKQVAKLEDNSVTMQEDYETLMKILNRARKLVLFDEEEAPPTSFKMDRNGNLEKMAE